MYRIAWQGVKNMKLVKYMDADPHYYKNINQTVPNSSVDEEDWHDVLGMEAEDIGDLLDQFNKLREWEELDFGFVRRVRIEHLPDPKWLTVPISEVEALAGETSRL